MQGNVYGLNIHLVGFQLNPEIMHNNEKIRVSITTIPDEKKQHFKIDPKNISSVHHFFTVNISDETKKILFVFRRKNFIQADPIIASTIVKTDQLPKSPDDKNNTEVKSISIFEPIQHIQKEKKGMEEIDKNINMNRKVVGTMQVQFELTDPFPEQSFHKKEGGKKKGHLSAKRGYAKLDNDENVVSNLIQS